MVGGIRGRNNYWLQEDGGEKSPGENGIANGAGDDDEYKTGVFYGKCKFHGSGREDIDVRMLCLEGGGGRPFCCEVIDADRVPGRDAIRVGERVINGFDRDVVEDPDYGR